MILHLLFFITLPFFAQAAETARYTFEEGSGTVVHDTSGNGRDATIVGSGAANWAWVSTKPHALFGTYCGYRGFSWNTAWVNVPTSVFTASMANGANATGSMKVSFFSSNLDGWPPAGYTALAGFVSNGVECGLYQYFAAFTTKYITSAMKTSGGRTVVDSGLAWWPGRWYTVWLDWYPGGYSVYLYDYTSETTTRLISDSKTLDVSNITAVRLGSFNGSTSQQACMIDNAVFYDTPLGNIPDPDKNSAVPGYYIVNGGASPVMVSPCDVGWSERTSFYYKCTNTGKPYYFIGNNQSDNEFNTLCSLNNGVGSQNSSQGLTYLLEVEKNYNQYGQGDGSKAVYILGPYSGDTLGSTSTTTKINLDAIANTIWAFAPKALLVFVNHYAMGTLPNYPIYNLGVDASFQGFKTQGKRVIFADALNAIPPNLCADNQHPNATWYNAFGLYLYDLLDSALTTPTALQQAPSILPGWWWSPWIHGN